MFWLLTFVVLAFVAGMLVAALFRSGRIIERLEETEPLVCAHCGEDPDPDGEWFARNCA